MKLFVFKYFFDIVGWKELHGMSTKIILAKNKQRALEIFDKIKGNKIEGIIEINIDKEQTVHIC